MNLREKIVNPYNKKTQHTRWLIFEDAIEKTFTVIQSHAKEQGWMKSRDCDRKGTRFCKLLCEGNSGSSEICTKYKSLTSEDFK
jgi:hypothetical protein